MLAEDYVPVLPPRRRNNTNPNSTSKETEPEDGNEIIEGLPARLTTLLKLHAYSLIFAFEFPRAQRPNTTPLYSLYADLLQPQLDHRWAIAAAGSDGATATYSGDVSGEELPPVVSYEGCVSAGGPKAGESW